MTVVRALCDVIVAFNWLKLCVDHHHFVALSTTNIIYYLQSDVEEFFKIRTQDSVDEKNLSYIFQFLYQDLYRVSWKDTDVEMQRFALASETFDLLQGLPHHNHICDYFIADFTIDGSQITSNVFDLSDHITSLKVTLDLLVSSLMTSSAGCFHYSSLGGTLVTSR